MHGEVTKHRKGSQKQARTTKTQSQIETGRQGIPWWTGGPSVLPPLGLGFSPWLGSHDLHKLHGVTKDNIKKRKKEADMWEQGPRLGQQLGHSVERWEVGWLGFREDAPPEVGDILVRFRCVTVLK